MVCVPSVFNDQQARIGYCRKLYADEKAKLNARRKTQEQAKAGSTLLVKAKPGAGTARGQSPSAPLGKALLTAPAVKCSCTGASYQLR